MSVFAHIFGETRLSGQIRPILLFSFLFCLFLMGGGARDDIASLLILRPLSVIMCGAALLFASASDLRRIAVPLTLLLAFMIFVAVQLIPLPHAVWSALPGRALYDEIGRQAGLGAIARPMTLSPARTLNTLGSLFAPLAVLLLCAIQPPAVRERLLGLILLFGVASALLGLLQIMGPLDNPLYLYRITNQGSAVGFLANRNHQSVLLACAIVLATWQLIQRSRTLSAIRSEYLIPAIALIVPIIFLNGSRAGLLLAGLAIFASLWMVYKEERSGNRHRKSKRQNFSLLIMGALGLIVALVALVIQFNRSAALDRLISTDLSGELRAQITPTLFDMIAHYFPYGAGAGSFVVTYPQFEQDAMLQPMFVNQAHNDFLQMLIENGVAGLLVLIALALWLLRAGWRILRTTDRTHALNGLTALILLIFLGFASLGDYPLRAPSMAGVSALCVAVLSFSVYGRISAGPMEP